MTTKQDVNYLVYGIIACIIAVHKELGPGLLESIYEEALVIELRNEGYFVEQQKEVPISYKGHILKHPLKCDLLVEKLILIELKAVTTMNPIFTTMTLSYMKLMKKPKGLLVNFTVKNMVNEGITQYVNEYYKALPD